MIPDNGNTFKAAAKGISTVLNSSEVQGYSANTRVQWSFNLERPPGGEACLRG